MSAHEAIYTRLSGNAAVRAIVDDRIYPARTPQDTTLPKIVFTTISQGRAPNTAGASGVTNPRIQIDCWADSNAGADALADAVRLALDGYRGTVASVQIRSCFLDAQRDAIVEPRDGGEQRIFGRSLDFNIWHLETVPTF